ncbi:MAG: hypothetical protein NZ602_01790 [Thermoguttaceae bacterium]|nr:hypothetical protein [Thermoguttaceae bacterium]MDW8036918.1 hypothetical protein [Thermoguttaceae bacterium]
MRVGPAWLYPQAEHLHYAVLNSRDREVLLRVGVPAVGAFICFRIRE